MHGDIRHLRQEVARMIGEEESTLRHEMYHEIRRLREEIRSLREELAKHGLADRSGGQR
jgi:ubiquinone biosynthesis protein UbiJ